MTRVKKEPMRARRFCETAVTNGNEHAICKLAEFYERGCREMEIVRDVVVAIKW